MAEPTSGTWTVEGELDGSSYSLHTSPRYQAAIYADNAVIADIRLSDFVDTRSQEEAQANALLFAASKELLSALQGILAEPYGCSLCDSGKPRNPGKGHQPDCSYEVARAAIAKARSDQP
jgi:hypothetical protein